MLNNSCAADMTAARDIKVDLRCVGYWTDLYRLLGFSSDEEAISLQYKGINYINSFHIVIAIFVSNEA